MEFEEINHLSLTDKDKILKLFSPDEIMMIAEICNSMYPLLQQAEMFFTKLLITERLSSNVTDTNQSAEFAREWIKAFGVLKVQSQRLNSTSALN